MASEMTMLPDEATWANLSNEELRSLLLSMKRSANAVTLKVQEYEKENKRLQKERAELLSANERLTRTMKTVQDDARADREGRDNALMLFALYRLVATNRPDAMELLDGAIGRIEKITVWPEGDMKVLAKSLLDQVLERVDAEKRAKRKRLPTKEGNVRVTINEKTGIGVAKAGPGTDLRDVIGPLSTLRDVIDRPSTKTKPKARRSR